MTTAFRPLIGVDVFVARLREQGRVVAISPDVAAKAAIGRNVLDQARRAPAAEAGRTQATSAAAAVRAVWD